MQVRLQRINVADIPGLRNQVAAAMAAAGAAQRGQSAATDEPTIGDVATTDVAAAADAAATPAANDAADVETNQGRKQPTTSSINDAVATGAEGAQDKPGQEKVEVVENSGQENLQHGDGDGQIAGMSKTLENLNFVAADIINMSDETTVASSPPTNGTQQPDQTLIHTHVHVHQTQPKARQLENNLPELLKAEGGASAATASGEKQSCPLQAPSIMNDQQQQQQQQQRQKNKPDEPATATVATSAVATSKQSSGPGATEVGVVGAAGGAEATARPMMDDRQTVDFIEGDSPTSAANCQLNAGANHKAQEQQLMKTSQHTSNQVTTAAATGAAAGTPATVTQATGATAAMGTAETSAE